MCQKLKPPWLQKHRWISSRLGLSAFPTVFKLFDNFKFSRVFAENYAHVLPVFRFSSNGPTIEKNPIKFCKFDDKRLSSLFYCIGFFEVVKKIRLEVEALVSERAFLGCGVSKSSLTFHSLWLKQVYVICWNFYWIFFMILQFCKRKISEHSP